MWISSFRLRDLSGLGNDCGPSLRVNQTWGNFSLRRVRNLFTLYVLRPIPCFGLLYGPVSLFLEFNYKRLFRREKAILRFRKQLYGIIPEDRILHVQLAEFLCDLKFEESTKKIYARELVQCLGVEFDNCVLLRATVGPTVFLRHSTLHLAD